MEQFSAGQAAKIIGTPYHQLNSWARLEVVLPSIDHGRGYDGVRAYSFLDLVALKVVAELRAGGLPLPQLASIAKTIQALSESKLPTYLVGSTDGYIGMCEENGLLKTMSAAGTRGLTWRLNLAVLASEVREAANTTSRFYRGKALRVA